jgi:hypothetical protein
MPQYFSVLSTMVTICTTYLNIENISTCTTECVCVFHMILSIMERHFLKQHRSVFVMKPQWVFCEAKTQFLILFNISSCPVQHNETQRSGEIISPVRVSLLWEEEVALCAWMLCTVLPSWLYDTELQARYTSASHKLEVQIHSLW